MSENLSDTVRHPEIDRLFDNGDFVQALELARARLETSPHDRVASLYHLLANIILHGPTEYESAIDQLRWHIDLSSQERNLVRKIFRICYDVASGERNHIKAFGYQRLLRRLLLHQPLDVSVFGEEPTSLSVAREPVSLHWAEESDFSPPATPVQPNTALGSRIKRFFQFTVVAKLATLLKRARLSSSIRQ